MKTPMYNKKAEKTGDITLPEAVFGVHWNGDLVHQVVVGMQANARAGRPAAHTKDRSEVRGGGKKPWRQKGTGRARHGSRRSPIWIGGGVTHGPRKEKEYSVSIPKKMRTKALYTTLSQKLRDAELLFVDTFDLTEPKAKDARAILDALGTIKGYEALKAKTDNTALVVTLDTDTGVKKSFSNFGNVQVEEVRNLNAVEVLRYKYVIVLNPEESVKRLVDRSA